MLLTRETSLDNEAIKKVYDDIKRLEDMIFSAENQIAAFAIECRDHLHEYQTNNDKKIDILAVWVSKNINLLASSTRKKFKQLLAGEDWALLSGQIRRAGHCLSCNQRTRPSSANFPKTKVIEGKNPLFKITHVDQSPYVDTNSNVNDISDSSEFAAPPFKMTVPDSLRTTVSHFRSNTKQEDIDDNIPNEKIMDKDISQPIGQKPKTISVSRPRKFFHNGDMS